MPSVSICILARDEQDLLPACLASVLGADEILVLDTGSQDDTIHIATQGGARVMRMAWPGDFAVVRSAAAAAATGDWIVFVDADERLAPGAMTLIREAMDEGVVVGLLPITNADSVSADLVDVVEGRSALGEAVLQPRLLRRDVAQEWKHGVCEVPDVDLSRAIELTAHIVHVGACSHPRNTLRNAPELWLRRAAAWPDDAAVQAEAARRLRVAGSKDEATSRAIVAWDLATDAGGGRRGLVQAAMVRTLLLLDDERPREARHVLEHARRLGAGHPNLDLLVGLCAIELDDERSLAQGEVALRRALATGERRFLVRSLQGATGDSARVALATILLATDRVNDAMLVLNDVQQRAAQSLPARLLAAEVSAHSGDPEGALRQLLGMLEFAGVDGWVLAASAAERSGNRADALAFCDRAEESVSDGFVAPHRRRTLAAVRARLAAGSLLQAMRVDAPAQPDAIDPVAEGEATVAAGDLDGAHALFIEAIDRDAGDVEAWRDLGVVFQRAGAIDASAIALRMATELAPEDTAARLDLARCLWMAGQWCDAVGQVRPIVDLEPAARQMLEELDVQGARRPTVAMIGMDDETELADAIRMAGLRPLHAHADVVALMSPTLSPDDEEGVRGWMQRGDPAIVVVGSGDSTADTWCRVAAEQGRTVIWTCARAPITHVDEIVSDDIIGCIRRVARPVAVAAAPCQPMLTVIVPTLNREAQLLALLDRLALQDVAPAMFEVVVVDDGSDVPLDRTALTDRPYSLRVIRQANAGPASARNTALQLAKGRWVLFLDDDAVPSLDLVRRHLVQQGHSVEPRAVMGGFELLRRHQRTVWDRVLSTTTLHMGRPGLVAGAAVGWRSFSIANTSMPLWALRAVGGFDADGFAHAVYEDAELALRLESQLALPTVFHPEIQCGHDHRMSLDAWLERAVHAGEAQYRIRERHSDDVGVLRLGRDGEPEQPLLDALRSVLEFGDAQIRDGERALRRVGSLRLSNDAVAMGQAFETVQKLARLVGDACHQRGLILAAAGTSAQGVDVASPVSVVLVHDSGRSRAMERARRVVRGLRRNTLGPVELIVVVRGREAHWIASQADVQTVMVPVDTPLTMCWNAGMAVAAGATMMLCDDDILFTPGWRERLLAHMNSWSDVGIVAPLGAKTREELDSTSVSFAEDHAGEHAWPVAVPGARLLVRREVVTAIGGLDADMGGLAVDDFCMRAQVAGWRVRQAGDCLVGAIERSSRPMAGDQECFRARWSLVDPVSRTSLRQAVWAMNDIIVASPIQARGGPGMLLGEVEPAIETAQGEQRAVPELAAAG